MKNKKKISQKEHQDDPIDELENFIKKKNEENEVLKKIIDKLNIDKNITSNKK